MTETGYIYKITSPTGRIYVGKTTSLNNRITAYRNLNLGIRKQKMIYNSIMKYGWNSHKFEVLAEVPIDVLSEKEKQMIQEFNSYHYNNPNGMNLTLGGDGVLGRRDSEETKKRRADKIRGRHHREESKILMSLRKKGKPSRNKGVPCSEEAKLKISQANIGRSKSEVEIKSMRDTRVKNLIQKHEAILQIDPITNKVVKEWQILPSEISKEMGVYDIWKSLKNPSKKSAKYFWRYKK